jgi:hypothetical protein
MGDHVFLWLLLVGSCEAFFPPIGKSIKPSIFLAPSIPLKANNQVLWTPTISKVVDLSKGALVTDRGVKKQDFEAFFSNIESPPAILVTNHGSLWTMRCAFLTWPAGLTENLRVLSTGSWQTKPEGAIGERISFFTEAWN